MDYEKHRAEMLQHCIRMAALDKRYAWWAAKRFAAESEGVLADLPQLLADAMRARNAEIAPPPSETPSTSA